MRIAVFTNNYLPNPYGVSMSIESFRRQFEKRGHGVYVFAPRFGGYADKNPDVFRYPALDLKFKNVRYPIAIPFSKKTDKILEGLEIDIVHAQHPNLLGTAARKWAKKKNVPLIFTWHTLYDQYAHFVPLVPAAWASRWAIDNAVKYADIADQVIVPTPSVEKIIRAWGVTNGNIEAVPTGIDEENYQDADRSVIRKKYGVSENEILLLLVSRLTAEKNVQFLFNAVTGLMKKNTRIKFLVAGDGSERGQLEKIVLENDLSGRIFFAGIIAARQMKNYYAAGDIFVYASKSETQGMILTEAMYMGLPVVAVDATGVKDLVQNGGTGLLVAESAEEFSQAVSDLVENVDLRKKFGASAAKIAREKYTASVCAGKMLAAYERVINKRKTVYN